MDILAPFFSSPPPQDDDDDSDVLDRLHLLFQPSLSDADELYDRNDFLLSPHLAPHESPLPNFPPSPWLSPSPYSDPGNAQKEEVTMEVETRLPASPAGQRGSAPRYSPITPEPATPVNDNGLPSDADMQDAVQSIGKHDRSAQPESNATALIGAQRGMNTEEKLQLGEDFTREDQFGDGQEQDPTDMEEALRYDPFQRAAEKVRALGPIGPVSDDFVLPRMEESPYTGPAMSVDASDQPKRIQAFAKLEFDDGQFYMNTYAIEIGRDRDAARKAEKLMFDEAYRKVSEAGSRKNTSNSDIESLSQNARRDPEMSAAASIVSGGIMHLENGEDVPRRRRRRQRSQVSPSRGQPRLNANQPPGTTNYQALANASLVGAQAARPVDLSNMMPSPDECPLIPIHPPPNDEGEPIRHKGISRRHVKISYNHDRGLFEIHVMGRNGCFVDDEFAPPGSDVALASGTIIQIGGVSLKFVLPNVPDGETGTERTDLKSDAISQSGISYDFEDGMGDQVSDDGAETPTTDNEDDRYRQLRLEQQAAEDDTDEEEEEDWEDDDVGVEPESKRAPIRAPKKSSDKKGKAAKVKEKAVPQKLPKIKLKMSLKKKERAAEKTVQKSVEEPDAPVKRGPGRPPKNGIMSKREEAEIKRKEKEAAKAKKADGQQIKNEDDAGEEEPPTSPSKLKKEKKKKEKSPPAEETSEVIQSIERTENETPAEEAPPPAPKPVKEKRPPKPPRSPSPVWDESQLTPEQLAKPTQSYVILIHEALSGHPQKQMTLPQIYRAIERRYPYFKLKVTTLGWQSSVRHNLSQHQAFTRIERDGKGWMWGLDPDVSIDVQRRRRPSPPQVQANNMYGAPPGMFNGPYQQNGFVPGMPPGQGQPPQNPYAVWPNNPQAGPGYPSPNAMARPPFNGASNTPAVPATYQSPYDSARNAQQVSGTANTQGPNQHPPQIPQMPNSYLNQNRPGQAGPRQAPQPNQTNPASAIGNGQASRPTGPAGLNGVAGGAQPGLPGGPPAFSPPPPPNNPHGIPSNVWTCVQRFKDSLAPKLSNLPDGTAMLEQIINKCLGLRPPPDKPFKEFPKEGVIINTLKATLEPVLMKMNWSMNEKIAFATGQQPPVRPPSQPSTQPGTALPAVVSSGQPGASNAGVTSRPASATQQQPPTPHPANTQTQAASSSVPAVQSQAPASAGTPATASGQCAAPRVPIPGTQAPQTGQQASAPPQPQSTLDTKPVGQLSQGQPQHTPATVPSTTHAHPANPAVTGTEILSPTPTSVLAATSDQSLKRPRSSDDDVQERQKGNTGTEAPPAKRERLE